jgi:hypothetical protein
MLKYIRFNIGWRGLTDLCSLRWCCLYLGEVGRGVGAEVDAGREVGHEARRVGLELGALRLRVRRRVRHAVLVLHAHAQAAGCGCRTRTTAAPCAP